MPPQVVVRAGRVHVQLDTTQRRPEPAAPVVDRYALQEAEDALRECAAYRMERRRRARARPRPERTRAVDRLCARDATRFNTGTTAPPSPPLRTWQASFNTGPTPAPPATAPAARAHSHTAEHGVHASWPPRDEGEQTWWRRGQKRGLWGSDADGYPSERRGPDLADLRV